MLMRRIVAAGAAREKCDGMMLGEIFDNCEPGVGKRGG